MNSKDFRNIREAKKILKESKKFELWIGSDSEEMKSTGLTFTSRESAFAKIKEEAKMLNRNITGRDGYKGALRAMDGIYENIMVPRLEYEIREAKKSRND